MGIKRRGMLLGMLAATGGAWAASGGKRWPSMPVTLTVPFSPGGGTDMLARTIAEKLSARLGVSVIVENKPGAAGNIGAEMVARDTTAHRLLFTTASIAVNPSLYKNLRYDVRKDLVPVSLLTSSPLVLAVPGKSDIHSVDDLRRQAARRDGGLNYGSPGTGTTSHLGCAALSREAGLASTHIPYKGAGQVATALIAGEIDFTMLAAVAAAGHVRTGAIRAIGIAGRRSPPGMESVPLLATSYPQVEFDNWQALFAPPGFDAQDVASLQRGLAAILALPDVAEKIRADGAAPLGLAPQATARLVDEEVARYAKIVKDFQIQVG